LIQKETGVSKKTIYKYIEEALKDKYHLPKESITESKKCGL